MESYLQAVILISAKQITLTSLGTEELSQAMKLLTFLGTSNYEPTIYRWDGQEVQTEFAAIASCHFLRPDELVVFLTAEARQKKFDAFRSLVPPEVRLSPIEVPPGKTEGELWQIFEQVRSQVQPGDEVSFDVTHGYRSLSILAILAAAFLRSGFDVHLKAVLYGAFEAGHKGDDGITRAPMFDLTPMLALLEWATAADRFNRTGDSRYLASLIRRQQKERAIAAGQNKDRLEEAGKLGALAGALSRISQALHLIRPEQAMRAASHLTQKLQEASPVLSDTAAAQPFNALLGTVQQSYAPLALTPPASGETVQETLRVERAMIRWYAERELWVQAVSLAREWLISWLMAQCGRTNLTVQSERSIFENLLGAESEAFVEAKKRQEEYRPVLLGKVPDIARVLSLWPNLTSVRNDILHAGQRESPAGDETLIGQIENLIPQLEGLPL